MSRRHLVLLAILLLATALRFYRLDAQSLWYDEGNSARMAERGVADILRAAAADVHPPGYYLILSGWRSALGDSEFALRSLSALLGILTVALVYRLGRQYFSRWAGVSAALLAAINPFLVYYSQEARMYVAAATLGALSFLLASAWLRSSRAPNPATGNRRMLVGYCLATAAGLYSHYAFGLVIAAQNLAILGGLAFHRVPNNWRRLAVWLGMQAAVLALFLPWLPIAVRHVRTWPATPEFRPWLSGLAEAGRWLTFGRTIETAEVPIGLVAVTLLLVVGLRRRGQTITPLLWLIVPVGFMLARGLFSQSYAKLALVAVPPLALLLGNGLAAAGPPRWRLAEWPSIVRSGAVVLLGAWVLVDSTRSLRNLYFDPRYARDDYRGIAQSLESNAGPSDAIILVAPGQLEVFGYYYDGAATVHALPRSRPMDLIATQAGLETIAAQNGRLFVLYWGDVQADPENHIERWLGSHAFKAGEEWYGGVRLATYGAGYEIDVEPPRALMARFGDSIELEGFDLPNASASPGGIMRLVLYWRALGDVSADYQVFVHLSESPDVPPIAQQDGAPGGGLDPTSAWRSGEQHVDPHGIALPTSLPPGQYYLLVGLYDPLTGARLPSSPYATTSGTVVGAVVVTDGNGSRNGLSFGTSIT